MKLISIDDSNLDREHICCALGTDALNKEAATSKKGWRCSRFPEGLRFRLRRRLNRFFVFGNGWDVSLFGAYDVQE